MEISTPPPRIWVLIGNKLGDNAQVMRAAEAMGLPYAVRRIVLRPEFEKAKPQVTPSLHHIRIDESDRLEAPWPDLVITIGRRLSMVALWIKQQSGGKSRIALFNAPKGRDDDFDLVVAPAYYKLPDSPRLCRIGLPLLAVDPSRIDAGCEQFAGTIGRMPKPLTVVLLGGSTGMMQLDAQTVRNILAKVRASRGNGGSLYVSTSRRTPQDAADAASSFLQQGDAFFRWTPDAVDNPYFGLLAHGDRFVVTGDSTSMIVEVARLGKPLAIAELPAVNMRLLGIARHIGLRNSQGPVARRLLAFGTKGQARDFTTLFSYMYDNGLAVPLGQDMEAATARLSDDTATVASRLRLLATAG